jgi:hypothetical protein
MYADEKPDPGMQLSIPAIPLLIVYRGSELSLFESIGVHRRSSAVPNCSLGNAAKPAGSRSPCVARA